MKKYSYPMMALLLVLAMASWSSASASVFGRSPEISAGAIIYVDVDALGANDGTSWANAFTELQSALGASVSGDQIWVAEGIYLPSSVTDRTATFQLKNGVAVYGGFDPSGGDIAWEDRDWETNLTTLSGDIGTISDNSDNSYHVVTGSGVDATAILDGFSITEGRANGGAANDYGGGMYNNAGSPMLVNLIFYSNTAAVYGGGMFNLASSNPTLVEVTFSANLAPDGGGMFNYNSSPNLTDVTFSANIAMTQGGGMCNVVGSSPILTNVTFSDNTAAQFGGGIYNTGSSPTLSQVAFTGNTATQFGGGIYNLESNPTLDQSIFSGNLAAGGGGIYNMISSPTLSDVLFIDNSASAYGGGIFNKTSNPTLTDVTFVANQATDRGGAIFNNSGSTPTLTNITFSGNSAIYGGGMCNYESSPTLVNATFAGNYASNSGGAIYNYQCSPVLANITFSGNSAPSGAGMYNNTSSPTANNVILWGNTPGQVYNSAGSTPSITYSDVQDGCPSGAICTHVVDLDPQFIRSPSSGADSTWGTPDDDYGDLHLQLTSPAIDAGDNTAVPAGVVIDLDGNLRFVDIFAVPDTGNGTAPIVDMGAYEAYPETIAPTVVSILRADPSPTNAASVDYTVTFSEAVSGVGTEDFTLTLSGITGATVTGVGGGATTYTVTVSTGTGDGTLRLDIPDTASITDEVGNLLSGLPYETGEAYTIDKIAPTVLSILRADPNPTNADSVDYTVTFSEAVTGVSTSDFTLTTSGIIGAEITSVSGGPTTYFVTIDTGRRDGTIRLDVPATASIMDLVGNPIAGLPYTSGEVYNLDRDEPVVVSVLRADPNPTNASSVTYNVTFSEAVTGVEVDDFALTLSGVTGASVSGVSGGPITYTVAVSTGSGDGSLRLDIPAAALITDVAGNALSELPYTSGESYTIIRTGPTVVSILRVDPSPTNATSVDYTVTFSETVSGVDVSDFALTLSGITGASVSGVSGGPAIYTITVSTGTGTGTLRLDVPDTASITDLIGNTLSGLPYTGGESYTIDKTAPTVISILRADPNPTHADSVDFVVTFSEDVGGVDAGDFSLFTTGSLSGSSVTDVSGTGSTYTVTVVVGSGVGSMRLDVPGTASITDLVGNPLSGLPYQSGEVYTILLQIYLPAIAKHTP